MRTPFRLAVPSLLVLFIGAACSATGGSKTMPGGTGDGGGAGGAGGSGGSGGISGCDTCFGNAYTACSDDGTPGTPTPCGTQACVPGTGCLPCAPGSNVCVGNEVHKCSADGQNTNELVETCDVSNGQLCGNGQCGAACDIAAGSASNVGCEFWAVQLDQQDGGGNNPVDMPWGVALSNAGQTVANVTIELNTAPQGQPITTQVVQQLTVNPGDLQVAILPTRTLDCGVKTNDYTAPGTCLSSQAYRIKSSAPIVVYQYNVFPNSYSNDASLLLPTNALGKIYRVIGWTAGHPVPTSFPGIGLIVDRTYVTVVGTSAGTHVKVRPSWRIKGNAPIAATGPGGEIDVTIGPFDVLNLESDDATFQEDLTVATDLSGTIVESDRPVAVFTGVETAQSPGGFKVPTPPGWADGDSCCLDHLEDQLFPVESIGSHYAITRSPVRSTGGFREADVIRFLGVAETANVKTNLPPPYDAFTLQPGEVKTTYTQNNFVAESDKPLMIGQVLVSNQYTTTYIGDPSLTVFPPVEQYRTEYVILTPASPPPFPPWSKNWVVISATQGASVKLDGAETTSCQTEPSGTVQGAAYESRWCPLTDGVHRLSSTTPFGIVAYGYGSAGSYAFAGGADVKPIYTPPPLK